ncbi:MAG: hypothetical protein AAF456_12175 [Planctomycetota bacterium]
MSVTKAISIARKGMSFDIVRQSRLLPPMDILNSFLQCGVDDAASEVTIEWQPFVLDENEYAEFVRICRNEIGVLEIDGFNCADYSDWFSKVAVQKTGS